MDADLRGAGRDGEFDSSFLKGLLRSGQVDLERVELAAELGDLSACQLLDRSWEPPKDPVAWLYALARREPEILLRARVAVAAQLSERWLQTTGDWTIEDLLALVEAWIVCPSKERFDELKQHCLGTLGRDFEISRASRLGTRRAQASLVVALSAVCAVGVPTSWIRSNIGSNALGREVYYLDRLSVFTVAALTVLDMSDLLGVVRAELVPWVLGLQDPIKERHCERQES